MLLLFVLAFDLIYLQLFVINLFIYLFIYITGLIVCVSW